MNEATQKEVPLTEETTVEATENMQTQPSPEHAIEALSAQIKSQAEEMAKLKDLYLRAMAETENVRARARRDLEENTKYASAKFARDMVNIVDNLQRASSSISEQARASNEVLKQIGDGIDMTMHELLAIFERNGIKRINPEGQKFDHNLHQAVSQVPSTDVPAGNVVHVLQAGYVLHERLLKPAMVTVAIAQTPAAGATA